MRWKPVVYLGLFAALPGCNVAYYAAHNTVNDPLAEANQVKLRHRLRSQAKAVWEAQVRNCASGTYSAAYADGFIDGYADQLNNGGPPVAPGAPPPEYRRHANAFTDEGQARERDYLAGFRHGAEVAAATGIRNSTLVELSIPAPPPEQPLNIVCIPAPADVNLRPIPPAMTNEEATKMPGTAIPANALPLPEPPAIGTRFPSSPPVRQTSAVMPEVQQTRLETPRRAIPAPPPESRPGPVIVAPPPITASDRSRPWMPPRFSKTVPEYGLNNYYWAR